MILLINLLLILNTVESLNKTHEGTCTDIDSSGKERLVCCFNYEEVCIECKDGFTTSNGGPCRPCSRGFFGKSCSEMCHCNMNEKCDHVKGCLKVLHSAEAVTHHDHVEGTSLSAVEPSTEINSITGSNIEKHTYMSLIVLIVVSLLIFSLTCICWKYELSCKKRERRSVHTLSTPPNESGNNPPQGETHQYDEVDDGFLNQESSVNDEHDPRSSESSTEGSGICGVDGDGYLNPYHALNSIEITMGQGTSSDQSRPETSYVQTQENSVYFQTSE